MPISSVEAWMPYERGYHVVYREHEIKPLPRLRPDPVVDRTHVGGMRLLRDRASARGGEHALSQRPVIIQHKNGAVHEWAA